jgi:hypothetical protein
MWLSISFVRVGSMARIRMVPGTLAGWNRAGSAHSGPAVHCRRRRATYECSERSPRLLSALRGGVGLVRMVLGAPVGWNRVGSAHSGPAVHCRRYIYILDSPPKYGHILGKTLCSGPRSRPGRQAHGSTDLAPRHHVRCPWDFLGLVNTSRTSLVRNNERYLAFSLAVTEAFLEVSDLWGQFVPPHL